MRCLVLQGVDEFSDYRNNNSNNLMQGKKQQQALIVTLLALEKEVNEVLGILGLLPTSSFAEVKTLGKKILCLFISCSGSAVSHDVVLSYYVKNNRC